jgi:hypothetical protein
MRPDPDVKNGSPAAAPASVDPDVTAVAVRVPGWSRTRQNVAIVLWPSFLVAAAATMFFFAAFDPAIIGEGTPLQGLLSVREAGYAFGFFIFWLLTATASALTLYLARTQHPEPGPAVEPWMRDIP